MNSMISRFNSRIKSIIKRNFPFVLGLILQINKKIEEYKCKKMINKAQRLQRKSLLELNDKEVLRVVFFALDKAVWKYDSVFKYMQQHPRFEPIILVCPIVNYSRESMLEKMEGAYQVYKEKGYSVIKAYNENNNTYVDVRNDLKPDIIAYTNPYKGLIDDRYYIYNFLDILTFYVHYGFNSVTEWDFLYKQPLTNLVWRYYVETPSHLSYIKEYSYNKGVNGVVTGYPGVENLLDPKYKIKKDPWKNPNRTLKRLIWAPHHSIETVGLICFSNFLRYADFMIRMSEKYKDELQIAFKPHPLLKDKLIDLWGKQRTLDYYAKWDSNPNTFLFDGEYVDLFLTSDAMVHDSGSFLIEYLYVRKPVMRMMNGDDMDKVLNSFARRCFDVYYKGYNEDDVEEFINNVINGIDPMKNVRDKHYREELAPINEKMPSENIVDDILGSIRSKDHFKQL